MTTTASATLIAPRAEGRLSGGFLVNLAWIENAFLRAEQATTAAELERLLRAPGERLTLVDSLYLYDTGTASVLIRAARTSPVALLAHSLPSLIPGPSVGERLRMLQSERAFLSEACGAIAPSRFMADALARRGLAREAVEIVRPAAIVDGRAPDSARSSRAPRTGPPRILTVANWTPAKGIEHAVRALALVATDWRWTLVGSELSHPAYARRVRDLIDAEGLTDRVEIVRPKPPEELRNHYVAADLFLLPSLMESYGLVFSEAITFGLPVVGYRCAAVPELVGRAGELVSAGAELVDAGDVSGLSVAIAAALERVGRVERVEQADRADHADRSAPPTLPDSETSRSELERALRSLGRTAAERRSRR